MSAADKQAATAHFRVAVRLRASASLVARVAPFMARHDIRYYLNGVALQKAPQGGLYIVATDGHRLAVAYDKAGSLEGAEGVILRLHPATLKACAKPPKWHGFMDSKTARFASLEHALCIDGDRVRVGWAAAGKSIEPSHELHVQPGDWLIEGKFPAWRNLLPVDWSVLKPQITSQLQAAYIADMARAGISGSDREGSPMRFWQKEPTGAVFVQFMNTPELLGVVMPMRDNTTDAELIARMARDFQHDPKP
jgi:hypothetical protein